MLFCLLLLLLYTAIKGAGSLKQRHCDLTHIDKGLVVVVYLSKACSHHNHPRHSQRHSLQRRGRKDDYKFHDIFGLLIHIVSGLKCLSVDVFSSSLGRKAEIESKYDPNLFQMFRLRK